MTRSGAGWFLAAGGVAAILNAGFQRLSAREIPVDDLGAFNALVWVIGGIALLGLGLQVVVARLRSDTAAPSLGRLAVVAGVATGALVAAGVPGPAWYRLDVGALMAVTAVATFCGVAPRARLLRASAWRRVGGVYVVGAAVRLAVLLPLLEVIDTALLATLAATALSEAVMSVLAWRLAPTAARPRVPIARREAMALLVGFAALGGLWALTIADTLLARTRLDDAAADAYAFASTVGRGSFFVAQILVHLALPTFMREDGRTERLRRVFSITSVAVTVVVLVSAIAVVIAPRQIARLLLGSNAALVDVPTLRVLALGWAAMALLPVLTYFHSARHPRVAFVPAVAAIVVLAAGTYADTPLALATTMLVVASVALVVMAVPAAERLRPVTRAVEWLRPTPEHGVGSAVAVVVPFYNPSPEVLVGTVRRLGAALAANGAPYTIVAVSDGSDDGSAEALAAAELPHVEVVVLPTNSGKGSAIRTGLGRVSAPLVGYIDADGDLPPEQIGRFLDIAAATGAHAVVGSKVHPESEVAGARLRGLLSAVFRLTVRALFRLDVRDTQTGLKIYRGDVVEPLVPLLREDGFAIDVEILVAATRSAGRTTSLSIVEAPVQIVDRTRSTVSTRRAAGTIAGLVRIFWRDHVALGYSGAPTTHPAPSPSATR